MVLFEMLQIVFQAHLEVRKMRLLVKEGDCFNCVATFGGVYESDDNLQEIAHFVKNIKDIKDVRSLSACLHEGVQEYDYLIPMVHNDSLLAFVLIGDVYSNTDMLSYELNFIETLLNVVIVALENKKLVKEHLQRELFQRDLKLATEIQKMLMPTHFQKDSSVEVGALYIPNQEISGDYFDFIRLNDHEFMWCIADVSGKGIAAALIMASLQANIRARVSTERDLIKIVCNLNQILIRNTNGDYFITLFLAKYNDKNRQISYINAGHNPPVLWMDGRATQLATGTTILGAFEDLPFINSECLTLQSNSLIFNYTDGLVESADEDVFISCNQLIECIKSNQYLPVDELNLNILKDIRTSQNANMDSDDITLFTLKIF